MPQPFGIDVPAWARELADAIDQEIAERIDVRLLGEHLIATAPAWRGILGQPDAHGGLE